jgi:putrescine transport system ATP-binding protein
LPGLDNCVAATVADIGYFGDSSVYKLRIRDGSLLKAAVANLGAAGDGIIAVNEQVWLTWPPEAARVLTR